MKVEIGENNCLFIFLTAAEAHETHIHEAAADYGNAAGKAIIDSLYREAAQRANFAPVNYRSQVIEMLPFQDGSVLLCFRFLRTIPGLKVHARKKYADRLYQFHSQEAFAAFLDHAGKLKQLPEAVYESQGAYRLLIAPHATQLEALLGEYAEKCAAPLAAARTREYWRPVYCKADE